MTDLRPVLLLTRPAAQAARFAEAFRGRFGAGWPVLVSPMSRLDFLPAHLPLDDAGALIFTSETGVAAFLRLSDRRDLPAFCVGPRTAEAARAAGMAAVTGPGDALGLADMLRADPPGGALVHVHGVHVAADLAAILGAEGLRVRGVTAYDQVTLAPSPEALALLRRPGPLLLPLFSARAALLLGTLRPVPAAPLRIAAISEEVAHAAARLSPARLAVAAEPNAPAMLDALGGLIDAGPPADPRDA